MNALNFNRFVVLVVLTLCLGTAASAAPASRMHFSHISLQDGLSQNNVQSIMQDSTGYMWFATESGLNRYDGYEIRRYTRERGNPSSASRISDNDRPTFWAAPMKAIRRMVSRRNRR